jgi:hypothetical protein
VYLLLCDGGLARGVFWVTAFLTTGFSFFAAKALILSCPHVLFNIVPSTATRSVLFR